MTRDRTWKLLLVEDDDDSAEALIALLDLYDIETLWAIDGAAALQALDSVHRLGERAPDFVLLDINLPRTNTIDLGRELKRHPAGCPVILVSATTAQVLDETASRIGAVATLRKPFSVDDLLAILERHGSPEGTAFSSRAGAR